MMISDRYRGGESRALTPDAGTRLRIRFWTGGRLRDEVWIDARDPDSAELAEFMQRYHAKLAETADRVGLAWLAEVFDPDAPDERQYVRFGTDANAMIDPAPMFWTGWPR